MRSLAILASVLLLAGSALAHDGPATSMPFATAAPDDGPPIDQAQAAPQVERADLDQVDLQVGVGTVNFVDLVVDMHVEATLGAGLPEPDRVDELVSRLACDDGKPPCYAIRPSFKVSVADLTFDPGERLEPTPMSEQPLATTPDATPAWEVRALVRPAVG